MKKLFLFLLSSIFLSCATNHFTVKLDDQLYMLPNSHGQKLVGLLYHEKKSPFFSFDTEIEMKEIKKSMLLLSGNRLVPTSVMNLSGSVSSRVNEKSKKILFKGFIVNDISQ
jgi:hypothetical protein